MIDKEEFIGNALWLTLTIIGTIFVTETIPAVTQLGVMLGAGLGGSALMVSAYLMKRRQPA